MQKERSDNLYTRYVPIANRIRVGTLSRFSIIAVVFLDVKKYYRTIDMNLDAHNILTILIILINFNTLLTSFRIVFPIFFFFF